MDSNIGRYQDDIFRDTGFYIVGQNISKISTSLCWYDQNIGLTDISADILKISAETKISAEME